MSVVTIAVGMRKLLNPARMEAFPDKLANAINCSAVSMAGPVKTDKVADSNLPAKVA